MVQFESLFWGKIPCLFLLIIFPLFELPRINNLECLTSLTHTMYISDISFPLVVWGFVFPVLGCLSFSNCKNAPHAMRISPLRNGLLPASWGFDIYNWEMRMTRVEIYHMKRTSCTRILHTRKSPTRKTKLVGEIATEMLHFRPFSGKCSRSAFW